MLNRATAGRPGVRRAPRAGSARRGSRAGLAARRGRSSATCSGDAADGPGRPARSRAAPRRADGDVDRVRAGGAGACRNTLPALVAEDAPPQAVEGDRQDRDAGPAGRCARGRAANGQQVPRYRVSAPSAKTHTSSPASRAHRRRAEIAARLLLAPSSPRRLTGMAPILRANQPSEGQVEEAAVHQEAHGPVGAREGDRAGRRRRRRGWRRAGRRPRRGQVLRCRAGAGCGRGCGSKRQSHEADREVEPCRSAGSPA